MNSITHSQRYLPHTIDTKFHAVKPVPLAPNAVKHLGKKPFGGKLRSLKSQTAEPSQLKTAHHDILLI